MVEALINIKMVEILCQHHFTLRASFLMVSWQCHVVDASMVNCVCLCEGISQSQRAKTDLNDCVFVYYTVEMELLCSGTDTD